jgi:alpha-ketoglutarate-dependent taurine dioxygenase
MHKYHGSESESRARQQQRKDWRRLQVIYDNRNNYEPSVQELLYESPEEHQQECSSTSIHNWLAVHEATFIQSVKKVRTRAIQGVRSLLSYFPTGRPPGAGTNHRQLPETINGGNVTTQIKLIIVFC